MFIHGVHNDPEQWQVPDKWIPERFDSSSEYFKKPNGEPRSTMAFSPFMMGKRGCSGKTFAEIVARYTLCIIYYHLDFELIKPEHKAKKPAIHLASRE